MSRSEALGAIALVVCTALLTRELLPRTVHQTVRIPEPVLIDLSDSTRADFEEALEARDAMIERQERTIRELAARPPVVTAETTFVDRPVAVACDQESFRPRWRVRDLTVGASPEERTILRSELFAADSGSIVVTGETSQHVTLGPLRGVFPEEDGIRLEFDDWPEDKSCGFLCTLGHVSIGAGLAGGACLIRG